MACYVAWNKGKKLSPEHRENLRISHIGQKAWNKGVQTKKHCLYCNKEFYVNTSNLDRKFCGQRCYYLSDTRRPSFGMLGKKQTEKQKSTVSRLNSIIQRGANNSNWKGGVSINGKRAYLLQWRKKNPLKVKTSNHKRRLLTRELTIDIVQNVYEENIKRFGSLTCYLCLRPIVFGRDHLEHKVPISRGGDNNRQNLDVACQKCNLRKNKKTVEEFTREVCH